MPNPSSDAELFGGLSESQRDAWLMGLRKPEPCRLPVSPTKAPESVDPDHYKGGDIQCIQAIRAALGQEGFVAFSRGTMIAYLWRMGKKDDPLVEIGKTLTYGEWLEDALNGKPLRGLK